MSRKMKLVISLITSLMIGICKIGACLVVIWIASAGVFICAAELFGIDNRTPWWFALPFTIAGLIAVGAITISFARWMEQWQAGGTGSGLHES